MDREMTARVQRDLRRCDEALHAARTLLSEQLYAEAISRAYYAAVHVIMILLAMGGVSATTPADVEAKFTADFARAHDLDDSLPALFGELHRAKAATAHDFMAKYSGDYARETVRKARGFVEAIRRTIEP
jgi:uncharacterized protein (UPF0332 family)